MRGAKDTRPCSECGNAVTRYLSQVKPGKPWFCSVPCKAGAQARARIADGTWYQPSKPRRGMELPCATCGKPVYRAASAATDKPRFCSRTCQFEGQRLQSVRVACEVCGKEMLLAPSTAALRRFCSRGCEGAHRLKRSTGEMYNGRPVLINAQGYVTRYEPTHPQAGKTGRVLEHRLVMERVMGRPLTRDEQVDHINRVKHDNRPENLQLLSPREHQRKTQRDRSAELAGLRAEVARYRERYGPLD